MSTPSYACGTATIPLLGDTIGQNLRRVAHEFPGTEALVDRSADFSATYGELWELTGRVASALLGRGVRRGDRVAVWAANRYEWVVTQFATARIGAILVPLNPTYQSAELEFALAQSGTSFLLYGARFRDTDCAAIVAAVSPKCPDVHHAVSFEDGWADLVAAGDGGGLAAVEDKLDFDDPITIQYTSGTTGRPKGATLSHHSLLNNAHLVGAAIGYSAKTRVCVPVPLFHCFGMGLGTLGASTHGATIVLPGGSFDPLRTLETVQAQRCTSLYGVPTMFIAQLEHPRFAQFDLSSLVTGLIGGAPCSPGLLRQIRDLMHIPDLSTVCGMTETAPISTQTRPDDPPDRRDLTVGRPTPQVEVRIIDPATGSVVPAGTPGEQCTRGYSVMLGYWDNDSGTREVLSPSGWLRTGDLAVMDGAGYVTIVGRIKDLIIRGGENIYPREIEEVLLTHPDVREVHVIGVPDERYGEQVMAWVRLRDGVALEPATLAGFCVGRISRSKVPALWKFTDSFPTTGSGKVQKFRMREISIAELAGGTDDLVGHDSRSDQRATV